MVAPGSSSVPLSLEERLAGRLRAAGAVYATLFGSVSRGTARADSDIDVAVSFGRPMTSDLRMATTGLVAEVAARTVDLIDLEKAEGTILAQALGGTEILCNSVATRQRVATRLGGRPAQRLPRLARGTGTPDTAVLEAKLRELSRRLKRLEARRPLSLKALAANEDLQDILAHNFDFAIRHFMDIALHLCAAQGVVPATAAGAFLVLAERRLVEKGLAQRLQRAVGFRNVLVHEYAELDWKIVMQVLKTGTRDLADFGKAVAGMI